MNGFGDTLDLYHLFRKLDLLEQGAYHSEHSHLIFEYILNSYVVPSRGQESS